MESKKWSFKEWQETIIHFLDKSDDDYLVCNDAFTRNNGYIEKLEKENSELKEKQKALGFQYEELLKRRKEKRELEIENSELKAAFLEVCAKISDGSIRLSTLEKHAVLIEKIKGE